MEPRDSFSSIGDHLPSNKKSLHTSLCEGRISAVPPSLCIHRIHLSWSFNGNHSGMTYYLFSHSVQKLPSTVLSLSRLSAYEQLSLSSGLCILLFLITFSYIYLKDIVAFKLPFVKQFYMVFPLAARSFSRSFTCSATSSAPYFRNSSKEPYPYNTPIESSPFSFAPMISCSRSPTITACERF